MAWGGTEGERDFSPLGLTGLTFLGDLILTILPFSYVINR